MSTAAETTLVRKLREKYEKENWMVKLAYINITPLWTAYIIIQVITPAVL